MYNKQAEMTIDDLVTFRRMFMTTDQDHHAESCLTEGRSITAPGLVTVFKRNSGGAAPRDVQSRWLSNRLKLLPMV
ncbi:MAG: hypothetical protein CYG59_15950 [Chloroflexi bacterium]|nr:MAG: hypothetical protein CYG59_15950 [Chloroflexota bacterium]